MALLFDSVSSKDGASATTHTLSHTTSGTDRVLFVTIGNVSSAVAVNSVTFAGVPCTPEIQITHSDGFRTEIWFLIAPATGGGNDIVVALSGASTCKFGGISLTGSNGSIGATNSLTDTHGSSIAVSLTTQTNNSWIIACVGTSTGGTEINNWDAGTTGRWKLGTPQSGGATRPTTTAGSYTVTATLNQDSYRAMALVEIKEGSQQGIFSTFETIIVSESVDVSLDPKQIDVNDTVTLTEAIYFTPADSVSATDSITLSESVNISVVTYAFDDFNAQITVSDYKWLTPTLKTAQQQFNTRPYFITKIIDDTITPNQIITNPLQPKQGTVVTAPDGSLLAVGATSIDNFVGFWRIIDGSVRANWTASPTVTLSTSATDYNVLNTYTINVSDFINGTYHIDIYFFTGWGGSTLSIAHYYSDDGGTTWVSTVTVNSPAIAKANVSSIFPISISAGKPIINLDLTISRMVFYTTPCIGNAPNTLFYQWYSGSGSAFNLATEWSQTNVNSKDWILHSIDNYYANGIYYVVFSAFHWMLENTIFTNYNYSLYLTALLSQGIDSPSTTDVWMQPREILTAKSSATTNLNQFIYPRANFDGESQWIVFQGTTVDNIKGDITVTENIVTKTFYYLIQSQDFINFTYPTALVFTDQTEFNGTLGYNFAIQGSFYYLAGNGQLWQYVQNNTVADVSDDLVQYTIQEQAGVASSVNLQIGNQEGKWVGPSPTQTGASAIAKNKKIAIFEGYYNASSAVEVAPKNTFFIDDISQHVSASANDLLIQARDLWKKFKVTISRFTYNFIGPSFYNDNFPADMSTLTYWNQTLGIWRIGNNPFTTPTSFGINSTDSTGALGSPGAQENLAVLTKPPPYSSSTLISGALLLPDPNTALSGANVYYYILWQDKDNFLRIQIIFQSGSPGGFIFQLAEKWGGGGENDLGTVVVTTTNINWSSSTPYVPIQVRIYDYYKIFFALGNCDTSGNQSNSFSTARILAGNMTTGYPNFFTNGDFHGSGGSGIGCFNTQAQLQWFKFIRFNHSQSLKDLYHELGTKTGVFDYKTQDLFNEDFSDTSNLNGAFTTPNNILTIVNQNLVFKTDLQINNGEVTFKAKLTPTNASLDYGFNFIFRSNNTAGASTAYWWNTKYFATPQIKASKFLIDGTKILTSSSPYDWNGTTAVNDLKYDLTKWHDYKIVFKDGYMFAFIDGEMVVGWDDTHLDITLPYTNGYIGFQPDSNTKLEIKEFSSTDFWNQIQSISINAGDDFESAVHQITDIIRAWNFSDLFGRFKSLLLASTDASSYSYQNQIIVQQTDSSDKEYINQITVNGTNVSATVRDLASIASTGKIRDTVIIDYKITTFQDAFDRATNELINFNKFNSQNSPGQVLNVGSELFDVVTIINTGANSSNVNGNFRIYGQAIKVGGGSHNFDYSLGIQTGTL